VVERVPDDVKERVGQLLREDLIHLGLSTVDLERQLLPERRSYGGHHAG
jgi:hypothetical protein